MENRFDHQKVEAVSEFKLVLFGTWAHEHQKAVACNAHASRKQRRPSSTYRWHFVAVLATLARLL